MSIEYGYFPLFSFKLSYYVRDQLFTVIFLFCFSHSFSVDPFYVPHA